MRIWSDQLNQYDVARAARFAGVGIIHGLAWGIDVHKARKRAYRWDVKLSGSSPYIAQNTRAKAATWDEWGMFLARLFECDPKLTTEYYKDAETFHAVTGDRFKTLRPEDQHIRHRWAMPLTDRYSCDCGAIWRPTWMTSGRAVAS